MSSLIANRVKRNMCIISPNNSLLFALFFCQRSHLTVTTIIITIIACTTQLFAILLTTATVLLELHTQLTCAISDCNILMYTDDVKLFYSFDDSVFYKQKQKLQNYCNRKLSTSCRKKNQ